MTIYDYFETLFGPVPRCELNFSTDIECLVAIILSAQCTDKRVNMVTAKLFEKYRTVADYANANPAEFERDIYSTGFYRNKARNIIAMARAVLENGGVIPRDLDALTKLAGVGRKTASVFLVEYHKIPAVPVDTHVMRVARRLGLSNGKTPEQIERDLRALWPQTDWCRNHLYMVLFGRYYCTAKHPKCETCGIKNLCRGK